jgi:hypothetical protein
MMKVPMIVTVSTYSFRLSNALRAILTAGLVCGVLDGVAAVVVSAAFGTKPIRMFQFIASGLLGPAAFRGGAGTGALGIAMHFVVALGAACAYYVASRRFRSLIDQAVLVGPLFGIAVHLFMTFVVIPLSAIGSRPINIKSFVAILMVHVTVVGPSIALTIRNLEGSPASFQAGRP